MSAGPGLVVIRNGATTQFNDVHEGDQINVTVPAGAYVGLPMGLSFFARPFAEAKLLGYAFAYEQATHLRTLPRFVATATE